MIGDGIIDPFVAHCDGLGRDLGIGDVGGENVGDSGVVGVEWYIPMSKSRSRSRSVEMSSQAGSGAPPVARRANRASERS